MRQCDGSLRDAGQQTVQVLADRLGMQVAYLSRVNRDEHSLRLLEVHAYSGGSNLKQGTRIPLSQSFCSAISTPGTSETMAIDDMRSHPVFRSRPVAVDFSMFRSYLGTRIVLSDGSLFGTLAVLDPAPRQFTRDQGDFIEVLAGFLASRIEHERTRKRLNSAMMTQRATNADLERVDHVKSDFVKLASHEFRTALAGIQGFSEMIRDEDLTPAEIKEFASDINQDARRLNRMIDQMLNLDHLEAGRIDLKVVATDLNAMIRSAANIVLESGRDQRIDLRLADQLFVNGDPLRLADVIEQLVQYAVTRSSPGGDVEIVTHVDGEFAHVEIRDSGRGMSIPQLNSVFELKSHVDAETGHFKPSSGFGLAIVRQIVELHGGSAWTTSDGCDGAQYHVTIPLAEVSR